MDMDINTYLEDKTIDELIEEKNLLLQYIFSVERAAILYPESIITDSISDYYKHLEYLSIVCNKIIYSRKGTDPVALTSKVENCVVKKRQTSLRNDLDKVLKIEMYDDLPPEFEKKYICTIQIPYADDTKISYLFTKLGLGNQQCNLLNKDLENISWPIPFYDNGNVLVWNLSYEDVTVEQYLKSYSDDTVRIMPYSMNSQGLGADGSVFSLLVEIYGMFNQFMIDNPIIAGLFVTALCGIFKNGFSVIAKGIKNLEKRNATVPAIIEHLSTRNEWDEKELMKKYQFESAESLEYMMFAFGYAKENDRYKKIKDI